MGSENDPFRSKRHRLLLALSACTFVSSLQQTMVIPVLPTLERDFHTTANWSAWTLTAFLLTSALAAPLLGKIGDDRGKKRVLVVALATCFVGTAGAALAWNTPSLIAARAVAGVGGALFPLAFAMIKDELPDREVPVGLGIVSGAGGAGGALGMILAGLITEYTTWRLMFVAGALCLCATLILAWRLVPGRRLSSAARIDFAGAGLLFSGLSSLLVALTEGSSWGWASTPSLSLFAASLGFITVWLKVEALVEEPMIDVGVLTDRPVFFANVSTLLAGFVTYGILFLVPNFVDVPRHLPAVEAHLAKYGFNATAIGASLYLVPVSISLFGFSPVAGIASRSWGSRAVLTVGLGGMTVSAIALARWHDHPWQVVTAMMVLGIGIAFSFTATPRLITDAVPPTHVGVATGMNFVMMTAGGIMGSQVGAAFLASVTIASTRVPSQDAFVFAFWAIAAAALAGVGVALLARTSDVTP